MIYNNNKSNVSRVTLFTLGLFGFYAAAQATENGAPTTAVGVYDFGAGMMPPATPSGTVASTNSGRPQCRKIATSSR